MKINETFKKYECYVNSSKDSLFCGFSFLILCKNLCPSRRIRCRLISRFRCQSDCDFGCVADFEMIPTYL